MARGCCGGPVCACAITSGSDGIIVTGTGTSQDPFVITGEGGPAGPPGDIGDAILLGTILSTYFDLTDYTLATQTFRATLTTAVTIRSTDMPAVPAGKSGSFSLRLTQGGGGSLVLHSSVKRSYGLAPISTTANGAIDIWHFFWTGIEWVCAGMIADVR